MFTDATRLLARLTGLAIAGFVAAFIVTAVVASAETEAPECEPATITEDVIEQVQVGTERRYVSIFGNFRWAESSPGLGWFPTGQSRPIYEDQVVGTEEVPNPAYDPECGVEPEDDDDDEPPRVILPPRSSVDADVDDENGDDNGADEGDDNGDLNGEIVCDTILSPDPSAAGVTLTTVQCDTTIDELPEATAYWVTVDGVWAGYIVGAPEFVSADFDAQFEDGIAEGTILLAVR